MKRVLNVIFMLLLLTNVKAQPYFQTCAYVHGYWTQWENKAYSDSYQYKFSARKNDYNETFCGLQFAGYYSDEWNWFLKIDMINYVKPDKKEIKLHFKKNIWYEYSGTVEYYVSDEYPTIEKILEYNKFPFIDPTYRSKGTVVKRKTKATIKIAPYKKTPRVFNIIFDGCGIAFDWGNLPFDKKYFIK